MKKNKIFKTLSIFNYEKNDYCLVHYFPIGKLQQLKKQATGIQKIIKVNTPGYLATSAEGYYMKAK